MIRVTVYKNPFTLDHEDILTKRMPVSEIIAKIDTYRTADTGWRVTADGEPVADFSFVPEDGQHLTVRLVPEGAQEKAEGAKFGGALLTWGGILVGGLLGWTGVGAFLATAMIGAGVGILSAGIVAYNLIGMLDKGKDRESPEQDPSVRGSRNQARPLGQLPFLFGRRRIYADLAANPYTWVGTDGEQYLYQLFCVGQAEMEIDTATVKIGETLLEDFTSGTVADILAGRDPHILMQVSSGASSPPVVTKCVHEEQQNAQLKNKTEDGLSGAVVWTTPDGTQEICCDIFFYSGLGKYDDDGDLVNASVTVRAEYKRAEAPDSSYAVLGYFFSGSETCTKKELKTLRYAIHRTGLAAGQYTVRISRLTEDSDDNNTIDAVFIGSFRAVKNEPPVRAEVCRRLTLVGLRIKASEKLSNVVDRLNFVAAARHPVWSGTGSGADAWQTRAVTANPASCAVDAMRSAYTQQKLDGAEIDWPEIEALYTWAQEHGYTCNEYVCDSMRIADLLSSIASTCRAEVFRRNGKITVLRDVAKDAPVQLFTPRNSHGFSESLVFADEPDALSLKFTDAEAGWAENELAVYNTPTGNKEAEPETVQDVTLWGVTDSAQARRLGMYKLAVSRLRPSVYKFSADIEYILCSKGDLIEYAGDIALAGIKQGRIQSLTEGEPGRITGFVSDEILPAEEGKLYAVRVRKKTGEIVLISLASVSDDGREAAFLYSEPADGGLSEGDLFAYGTVGNETKELIVTGIQPGENLSAEITAVDYAPGIFAVDGPDFVLPEYVPQISVTPGAVDSGAVARWQTFATYNDSREIPPRPEGDGTTDGWHRTATSRSMWMSTKTAEDVFSGEWSAPVPAGTLAVDEIMGGDTEIGPPDSPSAVAAEAVEGGIRADAETANVGLKNVIKAYRWEVFDGERWTETESQTASVMIPFENGLYPEAEDLAAWRVRLRLENVYGKMSGYSAEAEIGTDTYGTWKTQPPEVTVRVSGRSVSLQFAQPARADGRAVYGNVRHKVQIQKPGESDAWYKPATDKDPYASTENWKDGEGFVFAGEYYTQTLPLDGQDITVTDEGQKLSDPEDTLYRFRVTPYNEAGDGGAAEANAVAMGTSVQDFVHGSVTHEAISTPDLSAISANLGLIASGGFGIGVNNFWALSSLETPSGKRYEGDFRVGGADQFIRVEPVTDGRGNVVDYKITIQVGSFQISSTASTINGEIIVQANASALDRTRITPTGTYYEHREQEGLPWNAVAKMETNGTMTGLLYSHSHLVIANADITQRRKLGHDIGKPYLSEVSEVYHFDTDFCNQHGERTVGIESGPDADPPSLVGAGSVLGDGSIDFTPAILSVAPYSEVGKSLFGRYRISKDAGEASVWTVDFWLMYIWSEGQILFDCGSANDRISIAIVSGEPNYNEPQDAEPPYNTEIRMQASTVYNVAFFYDFAANLLHTGGGTSEQVQLDKETFRAGHWIHIAAVCSAEKISCYIDGKEFAFDRFSAAAAEVSLVINDDPGKSVCVDELMIDVSAAEGFDSFRQTTTDRIPWGALDKDGRHFVLDHDPSGQLHTTIFDTEEFRAAVKKIMAEDV